MNNPLKALNVPDLEMNVLRVAVDHMVEHLEELLSDSDFESNEQLAWLKADHQERLDAAKRLKRWFAYEPTNPLEAVKRVKEAMK